MDDKLFNDVLRQALADSEVARNLTRLSEGHPDRLTKLHGELSDHLKADWDGLQRHVAEETSRYEAAQANYEAILRQHSPLLAPGRELRESQTAAENALQEFEASARHLQTLLQAQKDLEDRRQQLSAEQAAPTAVAEARPELPQGSRLPGWLRRPATTRNVEASLRSEAETMRRRIELARAEHEDLKHRAATVIAKYRQLEKHAAQQQLAADEAVATVHEVADAQMPAVAAQLQLVQALVEKAVLPLFRGLITVRLAVDRQRRYRLHFDNQDTPGLRQMMAEEHEIPTVAFTRLSALADQLGGGAIGISGPRGIGKSTLIRSECTRAGRGIVVPAPVEYERREFLLHLFAELCLKVAPELKHADEPADTTSKPVTRLWPIAACASGLIAGMVLLATALTKSAGAADTIASVAIVALAFSALTQAEFIVSFRARIWEAPLVAATAVAGAALAGLAIWLHPGSGTGLVLQLAGVVALVSVAATALILGRFLQSAVVGALTSFGLLTATLLSGATTSSAQRLSLVFYLLATLVGIVSQGWAYSDGRRRALVLGHLVSSSALFIAICLATAAQWQATIDPRIAWGGLLVATGFHIMTTWLNEPTGVPPHDPVRISRSRDALDRIRYQRTDTRGWSETVKLGAIAQSPISAERMSSGGTTMARVPLTYPEIVSAFHAYAREVIDGFGEGKGTLIIGIDELDKLSAEAAHRFMNEVKAIFDGAVPGCFYLVSISEEALAGFEQRGLPTRDVFDTAFDEMLRIDHLTIDGTVAMLGKRIIDLPRGVAELCHALAGGLPRDVIRAVRAVVAARATHRTQQLGALAEHVCAQELRSRLHGLRTELRQIPDWQDAADLADWAGKLRLGEISTLNCLPAGLLKNAESPAMRLLQLHACSFYQLATIAEFFAKADEETLERAEVETGAAGIEWLAKARNEIGTSWALSWRRVSEFRTAWGLGVLADPGVWPRVG